VEGMRSLRYKSINLIHTPENWRNDLEAARREREDTRIELERSNDVGMMHPAQGLECSVVFGEMVLSAIHLLLRSGLISRRPPAFLPPFKLSGSLLLVRSSSAYGVLLISVCLLKHIVLEFSHRSLFAYLHR